MTWIISEVPLPLEVMTDIETDHAVQNVLNVGDNPLKKVGAGHGQDRRIVIVAEYDHLNLPDTEIA